MVKRGIWLVLITAALLVLVSCSSSSAGLGDQSSAEELAGSSGAAATTGAPVGLLVVQPSFGFGMYDVNPELGQAVAIEAPPGVSAIDLSNDVVLSDGAGFALGSAIREGQTSAADISVVRVDLSTGVATQLVDIGPERESDRDEAGTAFSLVAVVENQVIIRSSDFGSGEATYVVYDATTGEQRASFDEPTFRFESDSGSCSGGIANLTPLSDGTLVGTTLGRPAILDPGTGQVELLGMCGQSIGVLGDFVSEDQLGRYGVFTQGPALTQQEEDRLLGTELGPRYAMTEAWGDLWWISVATVAMDESHALVGGLVQFDPESRRIVRIHSLGTSLGVFDDCEPDVLVCESTTVERAQLRGLTDQLVIMDVNENGKVLLFDSTTAAVREVELDRGGADFTSATLLAGNPNELWIEVRRMTVTKDDETGRSSAGPSYLERLDPGTGQIDRSFAADDLFFS